MGDMTHQTKRPIRLSPYSLFSVLGPVVVSLFDVTSQSVCICGLIGTEESYNEMLALQTEADRQIQKATLQANELIVQLAASQQELKQLDDEMKVAVNGRQNAKKKLERRCLEFETLKLRLKEVLGPDYKPNVL